MKPYYQDEAVTIYHGDCREILPQLPDESVDLVLTDPPYGVGKAEWDTAFSLDALRDIDKLTHIVGLMPGIWNIVRCPSTLGTLEYKWTLAVHMINGMARSAIGFGNWIPCLVYSNGAYAYRQDTDCMDIIVGNTPKPAHPSPKPEAGMAWFISRLSTEGNLILDPFLGSGTTAFCAKKLGRKCIGIEIEERYCEIAAQRCSQMVMKL